MPRAVFDVPKETDPLAPVILRCGLRGLVGSPGNPGRVLRDLASAPVPAIPVGILKRNHPDT